MHTDFLTFGVESTVLKYDHKVKIQSQQTLFSLVIVARDMICFVVGSAGVNNLVKRGL